MTEIQQHNSMVVDAAVISADLRRASARGRGVAGEREAPRLWVRLPSLPPLYIGPLGEGAPALGDAISKGGGGQGGGLPPKASGGAPHPFQP